MKKLLFLPLLGLMLTGCYTEQDQINKNEAIVLSANQGAPITDQRAGEWLSRYTTSDYKFKQYNLFSKERIESVLSESGVVGVRFYLGKNEDGTESIILTGVQQNGKSTIFNKESSVESFYKPVAIELGDKQSLLARNDNSTVSTKMDGQEALIRYKNEDPNRLRGFYWGRNIIEELLQNKTMTGISFTMAMNENHKLEPLLIAIDESAEIIRNGVLNRAEGGGGTFVDDTQPCPDKCDPELE